MRILFVRHGEPDYRNDCLTEIGRVQAEQVAERLRGEPIEELFASPLGRAQETARATARMLGLPIQTLDFMREIRWGSADGTPLFGDGHPWKCVDEMVSRGIFLNRPDWRENEFFRNNLVLRDIDETERGTDDWLSSLGYVREGFAYRHTRGETEHRTVVLFSHGGSSCAAIGHILNLPFPLMCAMFHLEFTGITILRFDRREGSLSVPCLELANDGRHIREGRYHRLDNL